MTSSVSQQLILPIKPRVKTTAAPTSSIATPEGAKMAMFAGGSFWYLEDVFRKEFLGKGIHDIRVGFTGGNTPDPTYRTVSTGRTGHAEAILITYDPEQVEYVQLVVLFYKFHDPTEANQMGYDIGTQYRSAIFYFDEDQKKMALDIIEKVRKRWWYTIKTEVLPAGEWWDAEEIHQQYFIKYPDRKERIYGFGETHQPLKLDEKKA